MALFRVHEHRSAICMVRPDLLAAGHAETPLSVMDFRRDERRPPNRVSIGKDSSMRGCLRIVYSRGIAELRRMRID
jgi:hypothetical protein